MYIYNRHRNNILEHSTIFSLKTPKSGPKRYEQLFLQSTAVLRPKRYFQAAPLCQLHQTVKIIMLDQNLNFYSSKHIVK